jgi:hypothetical protein
MQQPALPGVPADSAKLQEATEARVEMAVEMAVAAESTVKQPAQSGGHAATPVEHTTAGNTTVALPTNRNTTAPLAAQQVATGPAQGPHTCADAAPAMADGKAAGPATVDEGITSTVGSCSRETEALQSVRAHGGPTQVLVERGVTALGTDAAHSRLAMQTLNRQLDRFRRHHRFLGEFEMLGNLHRRRGGAPHPFCCEDFTAHRPESSHLPTCRFALAAVWLAGAC